MLYNVGSSTAAALTARFLTPTPYRQQFFSAIRWQIWPILDPSPLKYADVLNGWSLVLYNVGSSTAAALTAR